MTDCFKFKEDGNKCKHYRTVRVRLGTLWKTAGILFQAVLSQEWGNLSGISLVSANFTYVLKFKHQ